MPASKTNRPPSSETPHSQRRQGGGARVESSERVVTLRANAQETSGWTLNVSRGGLRAVVEQALDPSLEYEVAVGEAPARRACIAWAKGEADGQIVGLRFPRRRRFRSTGGMTAPGPLRPGSTGDPPRRAADLLGPDGPLARGLERYETRPGQLRMAEAVERALAEERILLSEAGTGTGKTLAYLVPAILEWQEGHLISTATRALQEQIFFQADLPLVNRDLLGLTVRKPRS